jgi:hypothetical protein
MKGPHAAVFVDVQVVPDEDDGCVELLLGGDEQVALFGRHDLVDSQNALSPALTDTGFGLTGLPYDWLRRVLLLGSWAERHDVILDCCYSGLALEEDERFVRTRRPGCRGEQFPPGGRRRDPYRPGSVGDT